MVTAAGTATVNRIPVLFSPRRHLCLPAARSGAPAGGAVLRPNVTANDAFKAVSRYWDRIVRPEQLMSACINAMRVLADPAETGAVTAGPAAGCAGRLARVSGRVPAEARSPRRATRPAPAEVARAVALIRSKRKPLVICGGGVRYSGAERALEAFCAALNVPLAETQAGKGVLPWDHPCNLGGIGVTGTLAANTIAREADLVIGVGTRLGDFTTASKWLSRTRRFEFLTVNVNGFDAQQDGRASRGRRRQGDA